MKKPLKEKLLTISAGNFHNICDEVALKDKELKTVIALHGYPPMWTRPNTFETLVHVILEQQVSLASALAALKKLQEKTGTITPSAILELDDAELRACYVSRQKAKYLRELASALQNKTLSLDALEKLSNDEVRSALVQIKGIGNWTIDVYLMFVLHRADIFPIGDLAAVNALKRLKQLPKDTSREMLLQITEQWKPYRTVAAFLLWHFYLSGVGSRKLVI
jgi:DNA-3-methyladenine glycosylase II